MTESKTIQPTRRRCTAVLRIHDVARKKINWNSLLFLFLVLRLNARGFCGATAFMFWNPATTTEKTTSSMRARRSNSQMFTASKLQKRKSLLFGLKMDDLYLTMHHKHDNSLPNGQPMNENSTTTVIVARKESYSPISRKSLSTLLTQHGMSIPNHIAFVCDGNARWAQQRRLPVAAGHAAGADRLIKIIEDLSSIDGIDYATFFAFSLENWKRSAAEVEYIFAVMERTAHAMLLKKQEVSKKRPIRIRFIGDLDDPRIPESLRIALRKLEDQFQPQQQHQNSTMKAGMVQQQCPLTVSIAVNYSARNDIVQAVQKIAAANQIPLDSITQNDIRNHLSTRHIPDPDLIVRTSGENRLSNWLLWEAAYAEFYVCNIHWPDFDISALEAALTSFAKRQRRFGGR